MHLQGIILKENGKVGDAERMFIQVSTSIFISKCVHSIMHEGIQNSRADKKPTYIYSHTHTHV
jgi:hypothetical protein